MAAKLLADRHVRHCLFFAHLALEKLLKAHVCLQTNDLAPRIHNLVLLAKLARLQMDDEQFNLLAVMNEFNLEGRYPDSAVVPPTQDQAAAYLRRSEEVVTWLIKQLSTA